MKYELTEESKIVFGTNLFRIKSLISFNSIKVGDTGGWVESENNLDQSGKAWVYGEAMVCGKAMVYGEARVCGKARVYGEARVCGKAWVYGEASVCGEAMVEFGEHTECPICITASRYFMGWTGIKGFIRSGCILKSISWWKENVIRCAEEHGYTEDQQIEYKLIVELVVQWMELKGVDKE